jgi:hypothetical protein
VFEDNAGNIKDAIEEVLGKRSYKDFDKDSEALRAERLRLLAENNVELDFVDL